MPYKEHCINYNFRNKREESRPLPYSKPYLPLMPKIEIAAQGTPGYDPRTDHLRPVLEYLLAQGNHPAQWWQEDGWRSDPGGELHYTFTDPINAAQLREHFDFPDSIRVYDDGSIRDSLNRVDIRHEQPTPPLSFELAPEQ